MQITKSCENFLCDLFLFKNLSSDEVKTITERIEFEICRFEVNEYIYSPESFKNKIGFVMSGECLVEKQKSDGSSIPLNRLRKGDCFGILAVFSKNENFPTVVKASKRSDVFF